MNNICTSEMPPINVWLKHKWIGVTLFDAPCQFTIKGEVELASTMPTLAIDLDRKSLVT